MPGWAPHWLPCVRVDLPDDATPLQVFELTAAVEPIVRAVEGSGVGHVMFAITASALEAMEARGNGNRSIIERLKALADDRRIELLGTSANDAVLPLLPESEIHRQLELNERAGRRAFGEIFSPWILWPPALAASPRLARIATEHGFSAMLVDENAMRTADGTWPGERLDACSGLPGFFLLPASRTASRAFAEARVRRADGWQALGNESEGDRHYVVTTFHVRPDRRPPVLVRAEDLRSTLRAGELISRTPLGDTTAPLPCSARSTRPQLAVGLPFATWHDPDNRLHALQWRLSLRMLAALDELQSIGLMAHPAAQALRKAVDRGWRKQWWEEASASSPALDAVLSGSRWRVEALSAARRLLSDELWKDVEDTASELMGEVGGDWEPVGAGYESPPMHP